MDSGQFDDAEDDNEMSFARRPPEDQHDCSPPAHQAASQANTSISPIGVNRNFGFTVLNSKAPAAGGESEQSTISNFQNAGACGSEIASPFNSPAVAAAASSSNNIPVGMDQSQVQMPSYAPTPGQLLASHQAIGHNNLAAAMAIASQMPQNFGGHRQHNNLIVGSFQQQNQLVDAVRGLSSSNQVAFLRAVTEAKAKAALGSTQVPASSPSDATASTNDAGMSPVLPHGASIPSPASAQMGGNKVSPTQSQGHLSRRGTQTVQMHQLCANGTQQRPQATSKVGEAVFGNITQTGGQQRACNHSQAPPPASVTMDSQIGKNSNTSSKASTGGCSRAGSTAAATTAVSLKPEPAITPDKPSRKRDNSKGGSPPKRKKHRRNKVVNVFNAWAMARHQEEGPVACATRFVVDELQHGMWPSPSFQADDPPRCIDDPKAAERQHKAHMKVVAASLEHFSRHVILPSFERSVASFNIPASSRCLTGDSPRNELCRTFYATLLSLREVITQNAERIFGSESFDAVTDVVVGADSATNETKPGHDRRRRQDCMEDKLYCASLLATGVVLAAIKRYVPNNSQDVAQKFLEIARGYEGGEGEFASTLKDDDGRSCGVMPNGIRLNREENIAMNVSLNWIQQRHPLSRRQEERIMGMKRPRELISVPETNACVVAIVENM